MNESVKRVHSEPVVPEFCRPGTKAHLDNIIKVAKNRAAWVESNVIPFVEIVQELRDVNWQDALEGEPRTWDRFCEEVLGLPEAFVARMEEGADVLGRWRQAGRQPR